MLDEKDAEIAALRRDLADAHARIREMIAEIDRRDELISDLEKQLADLAPDE